MAPSAFAENALKEEVASRKIIEPAPARYISAVNGGVLRRIWISTGSTERVKQFR